MAQAVIYIKLDTDQVNELADAVAARLRNQPITQSNPPSSESQTTWSGPNAQQQVVSPQNQPGPWGAEDPWPAQPAPSAVTAPAPVAQVPPSAPTTSQQPPNGIPNGPPMCRHGEMKYVQGGVARSGPRAGQAYPPFYACPTDRNAPDKCKSVTIQ